MAYCTLPTAHGEESRRPELFHWKVSLRAFSVNDLKPPLKQCIIKVNALTWFWLLFAFHHSRTRFQSDRVVCAYIHLFTKQTKKIAQRKQRTMRNNTSLRQLKCITKSKGKKANWCELDVREEPGFCGIDSRANRHKLDRCTAAAHSDFSSRLNSTRLERTCKLRYMQICIETEIETFKSWMTFSFEAIIMQLMWWNICISTTRKIQAVLNELHLVFHCQSSSA